jgi:uncharacterized membrane protein YqiK
MNTKPHRVLLFLLATVLAPAGALAVDAHHPESDATSAPAAEAPRSNGAAPAAAQSASAASMHVLRERMQEIRRTGDPAKRMQLIEAQMNQLDRVLQDIDGSCPMMELPPGMMGRKGPAGMTGGDAMLAKRLEIMEKRVDMLQMMLQRQNGRSDAAGASPTD